MIKTPHPTTKTRNVAALFAVMALAAMLVGCHHDNTLKQSEMQAIKPPHKGAKPAFERGKVD